MATKKKGNPKLTGKKLSVKKTKGAYDGPRSAEVGPKANPRRPLGGPVQHQPKGSQPK